MHCSFSLAHYKECIELARDKGYSIKRVCDYTNDKKVILLRHDIDFSLEYAYELANLEYDLGICSSYYVYLHGLYNALSPKSMGMIKAMKGMGHEIGLHYDSRYDIDVEPDIICKIIGEYCSNADLRITRTQHNPSMTEKLDFMYGTNPNNLSLKYISDSGRNWREGCMCKHIGKVDKLHVLVHPVWWLCKGNSRDEVLYNMIADAKNVLDREHTDIVKQMKDYCRNLKIDY